MRRMHTSSFVLGRFSDAYRPTYVLLTNQSEARLNGVWEVGAFGGRPAYFDKGSR